MSTGRKSQSDKFYAREAKKTAIDHTIAESNAKAAMAQKDLFKQGENILKQTTGTSDVFAVIARDSMETAIKLWNNSMENVVRETIRIETEKARIEMQAAMQQQLQDAIKGVFAGINEAIIGAAPQAPVSNEPVEFDLTSVISFDEMIKRKKLEEKLTTGPLSQRVKAQQELAEQEQIAEEWDQHQMFMADMPDGSVGMGTKEQLGIEGLDIDGDTQVMELEPVKKKRTGRVTTKYTPEVIEQMVRDAADILGDDVYKATKFSKLSKDHLYMYQTVNRANHGGRGFWKEFVQTILK